MDNLKYWVWLSSIEGIGSRRIHNLLQHFGMPKNIWDASEGELAGAPDIGYKLASAVYSPENKKAVDRLLSKIDKEGIRVLTLESPDYPSNLKNIYDPPPVLYLKGSLLPDDTLALGVVGSRTATAYGLKTAQELALGLASRGITVVSGMARGIDTMAHTGALAGGGRTIAVLGSGIDVVYPPENKRLYEKIQKSGAVISEFIPGTKPLAGNFPARNRIISGLSLGVIVVEAAEKSGSLITADFALEQGREVFAVPGNISSGQSVGTNNLIKQGAKIVTRIEDILEEFEYLSPQVSHKL